MNVRKLCAVLIMVAAAGCGPSSSGPARPQPQAPAAPAGPSITASPNPVPMLASGKGTTTITWTTGDSSEGELYLAPPGQPEKLFGGLASKGTREVDWIAKGGKYVFRLYAGKEHKKVLATLEVNGNK